MMYREKMSVVFQICFCWCLVITSSTMIYGQDVCDRLRAVVNADGQTVVTGSSASERVTIQDASGNKETCEVNENGRFSCTLSDSMDADVRDWLIVVVADERHSYHCEVQVRRNGRRGRGRTNGGDSDTKKTEEKEDGIDNSN